MNVIAALSRPEIVVLKPYSHAVWRPTYTRLHANEAPWRPPGDLTEPGLNRYPEPQPRALIDALAALYGQPSERLLATRGSDEAIDALSRVFLRPGKDAILQCTPGFGMYQVAAHIQGAAVIDVPLDRERGWALDVGGVLAAWRPEVKLVYVCSPNNPTANLMNAQDLQQLCAALDGKAVVVVDEAYLEFSGSPGVSSWLDRFTTLAVLRTLSKAHALAGARIGALIARPELIELARKVVPPYSLSEPSVAAALRALAPEGRAAAAARIETLLAERARLAARLASAQGIERVWPSDANFLLVELADAGRFVSQALAAGLLVRDMRAHAALPRAVRISVGTRAQNDALLASAEAA